MRLKVSHSPLPRRLDQVNTLKTSLKVILMGNDSGLSVERNRDWEQADPTCELLSQDLVLNHRLCFQAGSFRGSCRGNLPRRSHGAGVLPGEFRLDKDDDAGSYDKDFLVYVALELAVLISKIAPKLDHLMGISLSSMETALISSSTSEAGSRPSSLKSGLKSWTTLKEA